MALRVHRCAAPVVVAVGIGLAAPADAQSERQAGRIRGRAVDAGTRQPLSGVSITVLGSGLEAVTGDGGDFTVAGVRVGSHRLLAILTGYEPVILHDVVVRANRVTVVTIDLDVASPAVRETVDVTADYFSASEERNASTVNFGFEEIRRSPGSAWSPRLALAFEVDPRTTATAAAGQYRQTLPLWLLVQHPDNRRLGNQSADHYVVGLRRRLTPSTLLSVEGYRKDYSGLPLDPDDPTVLVVDRFADYETPAPGRLVGGGQARSTGLEGMLRKKLAEDVYGLLSYGYTVSSYRDSTGIERSRTFDSRHVVSVIFGHRPSDRLEYSARWQYASGRPYAPFDPAASSRAGVGIVQPDRVNAERLPAYHRLDLRLDHRVQLRRFNVVSFVSVLNAYNRDNPFRYYWDADDERTRRVDQWGFIPVGGFELEF